jgi:Flp pilus assembly protein protease CpaA
MNLFLIVALIGLLAATLNDIKKREVADWISYSLFSIMIALTIIQSLIEWNFVYLIKAVLFAAVIYAVLNALYYAKLIGGGDVKLLTAVSPVFIFMSIFNFFAFVVLTSGIYGIVYSIVLAITCRKKLSGKLKFNFLLIFFFIGIISGILMDSMFLFLLSILIISPYLVFFISAVEKVALIKNYPASKLTEGDWLLKDVKIRGKWIKASADGLSKRDIELIRKAKAKVWIKEGIPYVPVFFIAFILANFINLIEIIKAFF